MKKRVMLCAAAVATAAWSAPVATTGVPASAYVQNGLVGHWDGIENAGAGLHDNEAATWADLAGGVGAATKPTGSAIVWQDNCWTNGVQKQPFEVGNAFANTLATKCFTLEFRARPVRTGNRETFIDKYNKTQSLSIEHNSGATSDGSIRIYFNNSPDWMTPGKVIKDQTISAAFVAPVGGYPLAYTNGYLSGTCTKTITAAMTGGHGTILGGEYNRASMSFYGAYYSVRLYNRVLTAEEIAVNANMDAIRFDGADPSSLIWPDGYRYNSSSKSIEMRSTVRGILGAEVSVDGKTWATSAVGWFAQGATAKVWARRTDSGTFRWARLPAGATVAADGQSVTYPAACVEFVATVGAAAGSYVRSGLIAQWDAIENAGPGTHDDSATTWKALVGDIDFPMTGCEVSSDVVSIPNGVSPTVERSVFGSPSYTQPTTIELNWATPDLPVAATYSDYILFTSDESYFYRQINTQAIFPVLINGSPNKHWSKFAYSAAEQRTFATAAFVNGATSLTDCGLYLNGVRRERVGDATTSTLTAIRNRTSLCFTSTTRSYDIKYRTIRIYDRSLTAAEAAVNANIDQIRYNGADPAALTWPEGYCWQDGCVQCRVTVTGDAAGGTLSVGGGTPTAGSVESWVAVSNATVQVTATPAEGYVFCGWTGDTADFTLDQHRSSSIAIASCVRTLNAEFRAVGTNIHRIPTDFASIDAAMASTAVKDFDTILIEDDIHQFTQVTNTTINRSCCGTLNRPVRVTGSSPESVILDCAGGGGIVMTDARAILDGVKIRNFQRVVDAPAVYVSAGTVSNVCISGESGQCKSVAGSYYGMYFGPNAQVVDSVIQKVDKKHWDSSTVISVGGARFQRVTFRENKGLNYIVKASALSGTRPQFDHCLFACNNDHYRPMISGSNFDVVDCEFNSNSSSDAGAGFTCGGTCTFERCIVTNNTLNGSCPLVLCGESSNVKMTNCLLANNKIATWGAIKLGGKSLQLKLVQTTVANNKTTSGTYCGGLSGDGTSAGRATVRFVNTAFWNNTANGVVKNFLDSYLYTDFHFTNSCFTGIEPTTGSGNTDADPRFLSAAAGDFRLDEGSSCVDTGFDVPAVTNDLAGSVRPIDGTGGTNPKWDIGCYEAAAREIPLQATLKVLNSEGVWPCAMSQTVTVVGSKLTGLTYEWLAIHYEGDNAITNRQLTTVAENVFEGLPIATYSFAVIVRNDQGHSSESSAENAFTMLVDTCYVSKTGSDTYPYTNAATAARSLATAIAAATRRVIIEPGEYAFGHYTDEQTGYDCVGAVYRPTEVVADGVTIDCQGGGGLVIANAEASLHGVTFRNYRTSVAGPVLYLKAGSASNIVVSGSNVALKDAECVYVGESALLEGLVVTNHKARAVSVVGGTLRRARIEDCNSAGANVLSGALSTHEIRATIEDVTMERCRTTSASLLSLSYTDATRFSAVACTNANNNTRLVYLCYANLYDSRIQRCKALGMVYVETSWSSYYDQVRNCLIADNVCGNSPALTVASAAFMKLESSTVIRNASGTAAAGGVHGVASQYSVGLTVLNSIVCGNTTNSLPSDMSNVSPSRNYSYSCFHEAEDYPDKHNIVPGDSVVKHNGKLTRLSPCRSAGQNQAWHETGHDLDGNPRLLYDGKTVDMGCFECPPGPGMSVIVR